jgi:hypothetical protein
MYTANITKEGNSFCTLLMTIYEKLVKQL